jgi:hypothetical protein
VGTRSTSSWKQRYAFVWSTDDHLAYYRQYPRHTWQSWRDRYLKQLRNRPPSAFNIPNDSPPSPPSENLAEQTQATASAPKQTAQPAVEQEPTKVTGKGKARAKTAPIQDYTLDQLATTFSPEDWEELYAFVDIIFEIKGRREYEEAWVSWAESKDNQTAEQWQQYYDKVVRPQWLRDPEWKRKEITEKVEKRHADEAAASHQEKETHDEDDEATLVAPTEKEPSKPTEEVRKPSEEAEVPYVALHQATKTPTGDHATKQSFETKLMSSSTTQHESPKYIAEMGQNALKRVRGEDTTEEGTAHPRSSKRVRSVSPAVEHQAQQEEIRGTQAQLVEISSVESSVLESQEDAEDNQVKDQIMQDIEQTQRGAELEVDDIEDADKEVESIESDDFLDIHKLSPTPEEPSEDDLPSNTPTPRASRHRPNNFDTQAILSSPSQEIRISKLPRPVGYTQDLPQPETRSSSLAPHPESDASTTQSLQEFRRSLNDNEPSQPSLAPLPRARSLSLTPSATSSTDSGDPDPPLSASEMNDFFAEQNAAGFNDTFIAAALKRTRCRPDLADLVLEAWKDGRSLPSQRGIWSVEDDKAVESGDGVALARLEAKHTLDGWGGITERVRFLEGYRMG